MTTNSTDKKVQETVLNEGTIKKEKTPKPTKEKTKENVNIFIHI